MKKLMYGGVLLAAIALTACSNDLDKNSEWGSRGVSFKTYITAQTRVANGANAWENGDKVGVFKSNAGEAFGGAQALYTSDDKGNLTSAAPVKFENDKAADFYAYYPYADGTTDTYNIDLTDQTKHIDLLYAASKNVASTTEAVQLGFKHQLSYIVLNITTTADVNPAGLKVVLSGTPATGTFKLSDGTLTAGTTAADIAFNVTSDTKNAAVIAMPAASMANAKLVFTLGDKTVEKALPVASLLSGTKYTIPVTLSSGSVSFGNATITDWATGVVTGNIDVDFGNGGGETPTPPATEGDGTKAKPYTVEQAMAKQDNSKAWVTAYIVGYVDGQDIATGSKFDLSAGADNVSATNILIAASADVKDYKQCIPVQLPSGAIRTSVNLKDNSANLGKSIKLYGQLTKYFGVAGIKSVSAAIIADGSLIGTDPGEGGTTPTPSTAPGTLTKAADLTDGVYAIGYNDNGTYRLMTNVLKGYYGVATDWTTGDVPAACQFTVKKSGNGWLMQGTDGKYVYIVQNGTHYNLKFDGTDDKTTWALTDGDGGVKAVYGTLTTNWIAYSTQYKTYQAAYAKTQNAVLLSFYKIK